MFIHYIKIAFRNLRKYKSQTLIGVLGLTTACVVFAVICCVVYAVLTKDTGHVNHERMYYVQSQGSSNIIGDIKRTFGELSGVEKLTVMHWGRHHYVQLLDEGNETGRLLKLSVSEADTSLWDFFSIQAVIGNVQTILNTPNSIVLSESAARKIGKIDNIHGSKVLIDSTFFTITGIMKDMAANSLIFYQKDGIIFNQQNGYLQQIRDFYNLKTGGVKVFVMLEKGISKNDFQAVLNNYPFDFVYRPNSDNKEQVYIDSLNEVDKKAGIALTMMFVVGLLVLFVALFNIISFQTAQIYNRLKECAIRKVNGSGIWHLLLSYYTEICIIFVLSFFLGLVLLGLLMPFLTQNPMFDGMFSITPLSLMQKHLFFSVIFGLVVTFLFCLVPVQALNRQSVRVVIMGLSEKISKQRGRKIMLFLQLFIFLIFMSTTLILKLQVAKVKDNVWHTLSAEDQKNILTFSYEKKLTHGQLDIILQKLKQSSAIEHVFFSNHAIYTYGSLNSTTVGAYENQSVREYRVGSNFPDMFNVKVLSGRFWDENDAPDVIVVDETFAALFPDNNPLGMNVNGKTVIGIVEHIQMVKENMSVTQRKTPVFYSKADTKSDWGGIYVKAITGRQKDAQAHISLILKEFYPDFSREYADFKTVLSKNMFQDENFFSLFSGIFSTICLVLCLLGIYSAITMNTEKRRREVAIRKINGAEIKDVVMLFSKTYIRLWSLVCLLLFPVIYFVGNQWLETFTQRISLNVIFFAGIYISILALIFFMILFRILEVARCNPTSVLKTD